jgi:hypothetical protein
VSDIFEEVDEELRAERLQKLLKRYAGLLTAAVLLVVAAAGGWQAWKSYQAKQNAKVAAMYMAALDNAEAAPADRRKTAELELATVARDGNAGYRTLARIRGAALDADTGQAADAAALWTQVNAAGDEALLRDAATLQSVLHEIGTTDPATLSARLKPLAQPTNPWHALADEAQALIELQRGDNAAARDILKRLAQDVTAPDGVRGRANGLLGRLGE